MQSAQPASLRYQWLVEYDPNSVIATPLKSRSMLILLATELLFLLVFTLPVVTRATGVPASVGAGIIAIHTGWALLASVVLQPRLAKHPAYFHLHWVGNLILGIALSCLFVALTRDPKSPLWFLPVLYAALNATGTRSSPSLAVLIAHLLGPLATIPFFLDDGPSAWAYAGPVSAALSSGAVYLFMSSQVARWQRERDAALELVRTRDAELQQLRLARDLHDSVGSTLGLLVLQADLLELHAHDPEKVRQLARLTREAAKDGLGDLRGLLEAIAPPGSTVGALAKAMEELAGRQAAGCEVSVRVAQGAEKELDSSLRLTLIRVYQEALRNAVAHGSARRVEVELQAAGSVTLQIRDDGRGFDVSARRRGRGLASMNARARERSGTFDVESAPDSGTRLRFSLPLPTTQVAA